MKHCANSRKIRAGSRTCDIAPRSMTRSSTAGNLVAVAIPFYDARMKAWSWLRSMVPVLAIMGLIFGQISASARSPATAAIPAMVAMADQMPCCAHKNKALPDCHKACPLIALCMANSVADMPTLSKLTLRSVTRGEMAMPASESIPESRTSSPPGRPPRS